MALAGTATLVAFRFAFLLRFVSLTWLLQTGGNTAAQSSKALLSGCQRHHIYGLACTVGRDGTGLRLLPVRFMPASALSKKLRLLLRRR